MSREDRLAAIDKQEEADLAALDRQIGEAEEVYVKYRVVFNRCARKIDTLRTYLERVLTKPEQEQERENIRTQIKALQALGRPAGERYQQEAKKQAELFEQKRNIREAADKARDAVENEESSSIFTPQERHSSYGTDDNPERGPIRVETSGNFSFGENLLTCVRVLLCCGFFSSAHEKGWTPFVSHDGPNGYRIPHYAATFVWTSVLATVSVLVASYYSHGIHDQGEDWLSRLDNSFHDFSTGITLVSLSVLVAGIATGGYRCWRGGREGYRAMGHDEERPGSLNNLEIGKIGSPSRCASLIQWMNPTPTKGVFGVTVLVCMAVFIGASVLDPDGFFNKISDSGWGHVGAVATGGMIIGTFATLFHAGCVNKNKIYSDGICFPGLRS